MSKDLILIRAVERTPQNELFAEELREASNGDVMLLLDERGMRPSSGVISLNEASYLELGLYTPPDAGWRCGDYGLYMAWRSDPSRAFYWIIEDDVRISGDVREFFRICAQSSADLLSANLRPSIRGNFWWPHTQSRNVQGWACLFGTVRLSARAVEACYRKRQDHSKQVLRRALWPNDEGLVTTTVAASGLTSLDFNDLGAVLWEPSTYSVTGDPQLAVRSDGPPQLRHPIRFKERTPAHKKQTSWENASALGFRIRQRLIRAITARMDW